MTPKCLEYVERVLRENPKIEGDVLEIGSFDVNGSVRSMFLDKKFTSYVGIDLKAGKGVDKVGLISDLYTTQLAGDQTPFDLIVSTEAIEHDPHFWDTLHYAICLLRNGGAIIITTRNIGYGLHDAPHDYWRFTSSGLNAVLQYVGFVDITTEDDFEDKGTFGLAFKL